MAARVEELRRLAKVHNNNHDEQNALLAIDEALKLVPHDKDLLDFKVLTLWNLYCADDSSDDLMEFCDECLVRNIGCEPYLRLTKAQVFQDQGTQYVGESVQVVDRQKCLAAVSEIKKVIELDPNIESTAVERDWLPMGWEEHFDPLLRIPEFRPMVKL